MCPGPSGEAYVARRPQGAQILRQVVGGVPVRIDELISAEPSQRWVSPS